MSGILIGSSCLLIIGIILLVVGDDAAPIGFFITAITFIFGFIVLGNAIDVEDETYALKHFSYIKTPHKLIVDVVYENGKSETIETKDVYVYTNLTDSSNLQVVKKLNSYHSTVGTELTIINNIKK